MFKNIFFMLFLLSTTLFSSVEKYEVGIHIDIFPKKEKFSELIFKSAEKSINEKTTDIELTLIPYDSLDHILNDFKSAKRKLIILNPKMFFKRKSSLEPFYKTKNLWTLYIGENKYEQYYAITNKKSKASIKNLKGYTVAYKEGFSSSKIWFKSLLYKEHKKSYRSIVKDEKVEKKSNKLVLNAFFKKDYVSIVERNAFELMCELNPQLRKNIKIIAKSEPIFLTIIGLTNKTMNHKKHRKIFHELNNIEDVLSGSEFKSIIPKISGAYLTNDISDLEKFFNEYFRLEKKYEK